MPSPASRRFGSGSCSTVRARGKREKRSNKKRLRLCRSLFSLNEEACREVADHGEKRDHDRVGEDRFDDPQVGDPRARGGHEHRVGVEAKAEGGMTSEKKLGVFLPYVFSLVAFLGGWLFRFIGTEAGISGYYGASIFLIFIMVALINSFETDKVKPLFNIGAYKVTVSRIVIGAILLASAVVFVLSVPAYLGLPFNKGLYLWNIILYRNSKGFHFLNKQPQIDNIV